MRSRGGGEDDPGDAQKWALGHAGRHAGHIRFREIVIRSWKAEMLGPSAGGSPAWVRKYVR
ncbi:DUF7848 domain-containing protein [Streptomyces smyrnaeus]